LSTTAKNETPALEAWVRLLRGHAALVRELNSELLRDHGLTINDYEALLLLAHADGGRLRRTDLSQSLQLTPSGVTRMLDGLEAAGLVCKGVCQSDLRVSYAVLTEEGRARLESASCSHVAAIEELFHEHYSCEELESLGQLLGRLPGAGGGPSCHAPPA
jgi:DNA-binding MarR family transcriptional regulator